MRHASGCCERRGGEGRAQINVGRGVEGWAQMRVGLNPR